MAAGSTDKTLTWLIATNAALYLLFKVVELLVGTDGLLYERLLNLFTLSASSDVFMSHPWTILSYMMTHLSFLHLLCNMLWLYWFGRIGVAVLGEKGLITTYVGGGVVGAILYLALINRIGTGSESYLCGASAAVLSVIGMLLIVDPGKELMLSPSCRVKLWMIALLCIFLTFWGGSDLSLGGAAAHLGGLGFGLSYGVIKFKKERY